MNIEKNIHGVYIMTELSKAGYLITKQYHFYTRKQAIQLFRAEMELENGCK